MIDRDFLNMLGLASAFCDGFTLARRCNGPGFAWSGLTVTHLRPCAYTAAVPNLHTLKAGNGAKGKRWQRRRTLDRKLARRLKGREHPHALPGWWFGQGS